MKDPHLRLYHIRDAIERIEDYAASGESAFLAERMRQDAISRNMEIIGEAIRHLPVDLRASVPELDWDEPIGMRNWLIHGYAVTDLGTVGKAVRDDLPILKSLILRLITGNS